MSTDTPFPPPVNRCPAGIDYWVCPNMREKEGDPSAEFEHYACRECGRAMQLRNEVTG